MDFNPGRRPRPKSSFIESFSHQRPRDEPQSPFDRHPSPSHNTAYFDQPNPLSELEHNQQDAPRFPRPTQDERSDRGRSRSPVKNIFGNTTVISSGKDFAKIKSREVSPTKPTKSKSGTNLAGLLRPKSLKNLQRFLSDDDVNSSRDKENRTPEEPAPTPIYAQFASNPTQQETRTGRTSIDGRTPSQQDTYLNSRPAVKERPKSFHPMHHTNTDPLPSPSKFRFPDDPRKSSKESVGDPKPATKTARGRVMNAFTTISHGRSKSTTAVTTSDGLDPKDIDRHLEAMLDRRNIPENQRYKMRNLNDTIKMEFIRQDWAEMTAARTERPGSTDSRHSAEAPTASGATDEKTKRSRGKSFTLSRGRKEQKEPSSPTKKSREGTLGRHFRSKSTDSIASEKASGSSASSSSGLLSKIKIQQGPADYVAYLRKIQKPELVEVGKIHKLRLLLRNETVAWIEEFIQQGGMKEIVDLLNRIMEVEWREEHEDALLHENLLCLKALSTTARAMQYLHTIQGDLFPKLLHMLFDPEKKGPSEFTTRTIIISLLFTYIESASPTERITRAKTVLTHLRDPDIEEVERSLPFVLEMRRQRPYRVWCKEIVSVTKEVFWIFLHNVNVISLPAEGAVENSSEYSYMQRHFPQERPPVPAAPYVGGVEWDATNYLASHLDLLNAILACAPTQLERNTLRAEFRISGWERCLGGSLRLCKEKFYGSVHDGLRTWVAAAAEDKWDVKDVRYGPPPDTLASPKKVGGGQKKKPEPAPKIEIPKLDFGLDKPTTPKADEWLG